MSAPITKQEQARIEGWPSPPGTPDLGTGEVHVYRVSLDLPDARLLPLESSLSPAERNRASRFRFSRDARRFVAGRGVLRAILSRYLDCSPRGIVLETSARGKPRLSPAHHPRPLFFNLSHAGGLALYAITTIGPVGVDLERVRPLEDMERLAERFFAPEEHQALIGLPETVRTRAFFQCWTRKEAILKATGEGISAGLAGFQVTLEPGSDARVLRWTGQDHGQTAWSLRHLEPLPGHVGAVALRSPPFQVRTWAFDPTGG